MSECGHVAVLIITFTPSGTSTNVARRRVKLSCQLSSGHDGPHRDAANEESWEGLAGKVTTLLRNEDE
jgi:hypothetical protein